MSELSKATIAKIKMDSNKFKVRMGKDVDLLEMINDGLVKIVGEKDGELVYGITELGRRVHESALEVK